MEYQYTKNKETLTEVMLGWARGLIEKFIPIFRLPFFERLLDKIFASKFAKSFLGSYAMLLLM